MELREVLSWLEEFDGDAEVQCRNGVLIVFPSELPPRSAELEIGAPE